VQCCRGALFVVGGERARPRVMRVGRVALWWKFDGVSIDAENARSCDVTGKADFNRETSGVIERKEICVEA
jgi:hypothetical protein